MAASCRQSRRPTRMRPCPVTVTMPCRQTGRCPHGRRPCGRTFDPKVVFCARRAQSIARRQHRSCRHPLLPEGRPVLAAAFLLFPLAAGGALARARGRNHRLPSNSRRTSPSMLLTSSSSLCASSSGRAASARPSAGPCPFQSSMRASRRVMSGPTSLAHQHDAPYRPAADALDPGQQLHLPCPAAAAIVTHPWNDVPDQHVALLRMRLGVAVWSLPTTPRADARPAERVSRAGSTVGPAAGPSAAEQQEQRAAGEPPGGTSGQPPEWSACLGC